MSTVNCDLAVSLDGYVAGPNQSFENPLGEGGMRLHTWHMPDTGTEEDLELAAGWMKVGAHIMGRHMFGPGRGGWDLTWRGWWGEEPPYAVPVFVLTHNPREPLEMGRTTFHFVTDGIHSALEQARAAAGEEPVAIAGGASTVNQYLAAGLIDRLNLHVVPLVLGGPGERLFDGVPATDLEPVEVRHSPAVTHLSYAVRR